MRLDIRRIGAIKDRDEVVGNQTRVKVVKNKLAPPFKQVEFDIMYGEGVSKTGELIDLGVKAGLVEKSGAWFSYDSQRLGQGRENAKGFMRDNPEIARTIEHAYPPECRPARRGALVEGWRRGSGRRRRHGGGRLLDAREAKDSSARCSISPSAGRLTPPTCGIELPAPPVLRGRWPTGTRFRQVFDARRDSGA